MGELEEKQTNKDYLGDFVAGAIVGLAADMIFMDYENSPGLSGLNTILISASAGLFGYTGMLICGGNQKERYSTGQAYALGSAVGQCVYHAYKLGKFVVA